MVFLGLVLWLFAGPSIVLAGVARGRAIPVAGAPFEEDHEWSFFRSYSWLSGAEPSMADLSSTFWAGVIVSSVGLCVFVAGVVGMVVALVPRRNRMRVRQ